jgi:nitrogen fixation protein FixH
MSHTVHSNGSKPRELTGKHVLAMLLVFFGIIITVSIIFTTSAVKTFRGEDVKQSYRQGVDYNQTLEARAAQSDLGWTASINVTGAARDRTFVVQLTDRRGQRLQEIDVTGRLRHPADSTLDRPLAFTAADDGLARADLSDLYGQWTVQAEAVNSQGTLQFSYDLDLR